MFLKVTIKKGTGAKGVLDRTKVHVLTVWVDLTKEEKHAISSSGMHQSLIDIDKDDELNKGYNFIPLGRFMKDSGPVQVKYLSAFAANSAGEKFKERITMVAGAIKSYQNGEITGEESFEL